MHGWSDCAKVLSNQHFVLYINICNGRHHVKDHMNTGQDDVTPPPIQGGDRVAAPSNSAHCSGV